MGFKLYTIYDKVAKEYGPIWSARNDGVAKRHFANLVFDTAEEWRDDYVLYCVGIFNEDQGTIDDTCHVEVNMILEESDDE